MGKDSPFYYFYGNVKPRNYQKQIRWREMPAGLDGCTIAERMDKENMGCISKQTPGFEDMEVKVLAVNIKRYGNGGKRYEYNAIEMNCTNVDLRTGDDAYQRCSSFRASWRVLRNPLPQDGSLGSLQTKKYSGSPPSDN